jgi:4-hydroxy-tetrahydrodipicolinate synthase
VTLGFYECPVPYKRLLTPELTSWCAASGRFAFLKDTCCDLAGIESKLQAFRGSSCRLYNANSATLLESLWRGASGYSGVMANFHPELYAWLVRNARLDRQRAERLQQFLGPASLIERQLYPLNAKYHLSLEGIPIALRARGLSGAQLSASMRREVEQLRGLARRYAEEYGVP